MYLIEGLADGRAALFMKTHHAAIDGVAGFELLSTLIDLSPDAPAPEPPATPWVPDREPTELELVIGAGADLVRQPVRAFKAARRLAIGAVRLQRRGASPAAALGATSAPRTPFNVQVTAQRSLRFAELDFGEVKAVKEAAGVKVNDVVLAVIGGGLRRYLQRRDELPARSLVAFVPVTLRTDGSQGANLTSVMYVELGTDEADPRLRLERVVASAGDAKAAHAETGPPAIIDLTELTGPTLGALTGRLVAATRFNERTRMGGNVVVSNIPGVDVPLYASGASIERIFPIGPIADGTGLNITMLSYCGRLNLAVMGDRTALPDPGVLADDIRAAHDELRRAVLSDRPAERRTHKAKADRAYAPAHRQPR
jgi:WS/DGAT/MGAT family acyltransferase